MRKQLASNPLPEADPSGQARHYKESSYREMIVETLFLGELLRHLWKVNAPIAEVFHGMRDNGGYDLAIECDSTLRYIQLKAMTGKKAVRINSRLAKKPGACVIGLLIDKETLQIKQYLWLGGKKGETLPGFDEFHPAKALRYNAKGEKLPLSETRTIPAKAFQSISSIEAVAELLFFERMRNYLRDQWHTETPDWLRQYTPGDRFPVEEFLKSRIVYYPGSGTDGHAVEAFGSSHSAHCFVYVDSGTDRAQLEAELCRPTRTFCGYSTLARIELDETHPLLNRFQPSAATQEIPVEREPIVGTEGRERGFIEILERNPDLDDEHGAHRLAILFLKADGVAAYDALFCHPERRRPPFAALIQDDGFSGNYTMFGAGGLLEQLAQEQSVFPSWLLVAEKSKPWKGYGRVSGLSGERGGMHNTPRFLYRYDSP